MTYMHNYIPQEILKFAFGMFATAIVSYATRDALQRHRSHSQLPLVSGDW